MVQRPPDPRVDRIEIPGLQLICGRLDAPRAEVDHQLPEHVLASEDSIDEPRRVREPFVGVNAPLDIIWDRRGHTWGQHRESADEDVRRAVELHDAAAHELTYDIELDTSELSPDECVDRIRRRLDEGPGTVLKE